MCCSRHSLIFSFFLYIAGVDYKYMNRMFNLLDQYITVRIELINDNYLEDDEDFMMLLQIMEPERNIKLFKDNAIVTIVDDDSKSPL